MDLTRAAGLGMRAVMTGNPNAQPAPEPEPVEVEHQAVEVGDYLAYLKRLLTLVDRAMEAEGVDGDVRDRVVTRVLHGAPEPEVRPVRAGPPVNGSGW